MRADLSGPQSWRFGHDGKEQIMKKGIRFILILALILGLSVSAGATIIEYPLDCAGTYTASGWVSDFNLGVEFTDIAHVYIDWQGEITAARAVNYSNPNDPFPIDVGIHAHIGTVPNWKHTEYWGGESTYPNAQTFDVKSEFIYGKMLWSELFDGKGEITIYYTSPSLLYGYVVEHGFVTLNDAKLIVDGTLVPEPVTIILLAIGACGIIRRKKIL